MAPPLDSLDRPARAAGFGRGFLTDAWYFAAMASDLDGARPRRRVVLGEPIVLGRAPSGALFALRDVCPHRAAPLSAGRFEREADGEATIACPYHGWRFAADGRCVAIPSLTPGQSLDLARIRLRRFPVAQSQGMVFVWMAAAGREAGAPAEPPPVFAGLAGGAAKLRLDERFDVHVDHAVVGLMDPAHGPFVHRQWWWRGAASRHAKAKAFVPSPGGFTMARHTPSRNSRAYALLGGRPTTEIAFRLPAFRSEHVIVGRRQVLALTCLTPIDEGSTAVTQLIWSDHPMASLLHPLIRAGARRFLRQDRDMIDLQAPALAAGAPLMWIDGADSQARWYQALKREWQACAAEGRPFVNPVAPATLRWTS